MSIIISIIITIIIIIIIVLIIAMLSMILRGYLEAPRQRTGRKGTCQGQH